MQNTFTLLELLLTFLGTFVASSGFWFWLEKRASKKDLSNRLLKGLAHDRILSLGMEYIKRGSITRDEYENLKDYLYIPYKEMEGNGSAARVMCEIDKLPIRETKYSKKESSCDEITG